MEIAREERYVKRLRATEKCTKRKGELSLLHISRSRFQNKLRVILLEAPGIKSIEDDLPVCFAVTIFLSIPRVNFILTNMKRKQHRMSSGKCIEHAEEQYRTPVTSKGLRGHEILPTIPRYRYKNS